MSDCNLFSWVFGLMAMVYLPEAIADPAPGNIMAFSYGASLCLIFGHISRKRSKSQ